MPEVELASWNLDPDSNLLRLAEKLASGTYQPATFRLIPYPKKGGLLRHYSMPSVEDQVAFAVFGVLLAPFLEAWMPNFSFGNRWYRPLYRQRPEFQEEGPIQGELFPEAPSRERLRPTWAQRDFSLSDRRMYQRYPRAHGMFRRVVHWTGAAMFGLAPQKSDSVSVGQPKEVADYGEGELPPFVYREWWDHREEAKHGYWVHLDLQLAYPSVLRRQLRQTLTDLCSSDSGGALRKFGVTGEARLAGYPRDVSEPLGNPAVRGLLAERLLDYLEAVQYSNLDSTEGPVFNDALWIPPHSHPLLPRSGSLEGLPTGLAISGLLMNVYLSGFDFLLGHWLLDRQRGGLAPAAFLRFADDMILLTPDVTVLMEGIDRIWENLCRPSLTPQDHRPSVVLSRPSNSEPTTNLRVSWSKVEPDSVSALLCEYLIAQGWETCKGCNRPHNPPSGDGGTKLLEWFQLNGEPGLADLERHAIRRDRLEPFVTFLVERMSEIGRDTLFERFGRSAAERLTQLHEMVRLDIADRQVREDTRLAFAVNRLARAWISEDDPETGSVQLEQIRRSTEIALCKAPWKFTLWRAVLQAASRRPLYLARSSRDETEAAPERAAESATAWLKRLVECTAFSESGPVQGEDGPDLNWGEEDGLATCWQSHAHSELREEDESNLAAHRKHLMLSALRTSFWRALADAIRSIAVLQAAVGPEGEGRLETWSSDSWTFRAFSEKQIPEVCRTLSSIDEWIKIIYPERSRTVLARRLQSWWWELESLKLAVHACTPRTLLLRRFAEREDSVEWQVPVAARSNSGIDIDVDAFSRHPPLAGALDLIHEAQVAERVDPSLVAGSWLHLLLAQRAGEQEGVALANAIAEHAAVEAPAFLRRGEQLALAQMFGVEGRLPENYCRGLDESCDSVLVELAHQSGLMQRYRLLRIYQSLRRLALSVPRKPRADDLRKRATLYRVIWGDARKQRPNWPVPSIAPAVGLPTRIALSMLRESLAQLGHASDSQVVPESLPDLPIWCFPRKAVDILWSGRRVQLGISAKEPTSPRELTNWFEVREGISSWEVPPHAAFYLPWALGWIGAHYTQALWAHILLFQTAADGSESSLDAILDFGIGSVPLTERWNLRSRIPIPEEIWRDLDELVRLFGFRSGNGGRQLEKMRARVQSMSASLTKLLERPPSTHDFHWERIDVRLELARSFEVPYRVSPFSDPSKEDLPFKEKFQISGDQLAGTFTVRMGQIRCEPDWLEFRRSRMALSRAEIQRTMKEITEVLSTEGNLSQGLSTDDAALPSPRGKSKIDLVVLPEVTVPRSEIGSLMRAASRQESAILAGLLWRRIRPAVQPHEGATGLRLIANEAMLIVPLRVEGDPGPPITRGFFVEKPVPAHIEEGLAKAFSEEDGNEWALLAGRRWYRFVHPAWGEFTVAICSDLIDSTPWAALRGEVLHLLMCSYNPDVGLYESLTWARAYENYVNVVAVNHGRYGGSMAWSPKRHGRNEVARLRGSDLFVTADVHLVVKDLWERQFEEQRDKTIEAEAEFWRSGKKPEGELFKSPPPGFPIRKHRT